MIMLQKTETDLFKVLFAGLFFFHSLFNCSIAEAQIERDMATEEIILENDHLKVLLNGDKPSVIAYHLKENDGTILGNTGNSGPGIAFLKGAESVMRTKTQTTYEVFPETDKVSYHARINYEDRPAIEFDLIYTLRENELDIVLNHVVEHADFKLLNVQLTGLLTVTSDEHHAKLVIPADAGRLIDIETASIKGYEYEIDWLNPVLTGFAYNTRAIGILDTESIENHTLARVFESRGVRHGSLSMRMMYRLNAYDLEEFGTVIPVTDPAYLLQVQDSCEVTISICGDYDKDGKVSWVDGTKFVREKIDAIPNPYYRDKTFVRTFLDRRGGEEEEITFDEVLNRIKEFAAQTDSAAVVMYLLGWQYTGHDTGYPSVAEVNENLGGYDRLVHLIEEARKYNVVVTFYDNYDDAYPNHPGWDPDVICIDPQGNLMRGGAWDGSQSYLISSYKYAVKSGLERVRFTLDRYPIREAYFIDVIAGGFNGGRKYDFDPKNPAGAIKNFEGKLMILREFNKHGVDVATEDFTGFFVGHVGSFGDIIAFDNVYFWGEAQIPMIPFIYHGKTSFGMKISSPSFYVKTFLYGQRAQKFTNKRRVFTPADYMLDALPKQKLYGEPMSTYERYGDFERVTYENGSMVEINAKADTYKVILEDGLVIAENYTSFVPIKENIFLACSRDGGTFTYKVPARWTDLDRIAVYRIEKSGSLQEMDFTLEYRKLEFAAAPMTPYKVIYRE